MTETQRDFEFSDELPGRFKRFVDFHQKNPVVWRLFKAFAGQARKSGREYFGARQIGERIRWYTSIETTDEVYKLNDHYWPYYSRLLMLTDSSFAGFFERRDQNFDATDEMILRYCRDDTY